MHTSQQTLKMHEEKLIYQKGKGNKYTLVVEDFKTSFLVTDFKRLKISKNIGALNSINRFDLIDV